MARGRSGAGRPRARPGWWFWGPFVFGLFFLVGGVAFLAGATQIDAGAGGLRLTGVIWLVIGLAAVGVAIYARRDIRSPDEPARLEGVLAADDERRLRATGTPATATIRAYKFLGRHLDGGTLVELHLSIAAGPVTHDVVDDRLVPVAAARDLAAGATVPVFVAPGDPDRFAVDWPGLRAAPATP